MLREIVKELLFQDCTSVNIASEIIYAINSNYNLKNEDLTNLVQLIDWSISKKDDVITAVPVKPSKLAAEVHNSNAIYLFYLT